MGLTVILIGVEHPGNLGAVARAMKNFGCDRLLLIDPDCAIGDEARNRAKWANEVLDKAETGNRDALDRFDLLVGTTAQLGSDYNLPRTPLAPDSLAERLAKAEGEIGLVFGRESVGLPDGLRSRYPDSLVRIPLRRRPGISLNLSTAVGIVLYEVERQRR